MSSPTRRIFALLLMSASLIPSVTARVLWTPEEFNPDAGRILHPKRDLAKCPTDNTLNQCPGDLPPNFCCPAEMTCLHIETNNSSVTAALCCPAGQDCRTINPISCDITLQDATKIPNSQLHSIPTEKLDICGNGCCPMGYSCKDSGQCVANVPLSDGSSTISPSPTSGSGSGTTQAPAAENGHTSSPTSTDNSGGTEFNGKSFAAGFIPGIALGAIIAALLVLCCLRKKKSRTGRSNMYYGEKSRDTLTDLSTLQYRPTMHGRSISEPAIDPSATVARTDFLRSSPARTMGSDEIINNNYTAENAPETPGSRTPKIKAFFSRSPFMNPTPSTPPMTQAPLPAHLKRGTLSYAISPIRALKKQKSMHSLRRQMNESRTESTETIQVLMSPDPEPSYTQQSTGPVLAANGPAAVQEPRQTFYASSSRYPSELPPKPFKMATPPPPVPRHQTNAADGPSFLDSPYTPTKAQSKGGGLVVPGAAGDDRRETTFSSLMERAGLRKSDLLVGTKKKTDGKSGP